MTTLPSAKPRFLVCEDGEEYIERFQRFLGDHYEFVQASCASELLTHLAQYTPVVAVLLDLDFRRTEPALLVDSEGNPAVNSTPEEHKRLVANQGIAILACLRRKHQVPALLFADLAPAQRTFLQQRFAPLRIVPSNVSLRELQDKLDTLTLEQTKV